MGKTIELKIKNWKNPYREIAEALTPHRNEEKGSVTFIVEGTTETPIIGIKYPGRRVEEKPSGKKYKWQNLLDFVVVPFADRKELDPNNFTFEKLARDFYEHKKENDEFWTMIEEVYYTNELTRKPPKLAGIDPELFLLVLKWIWIQEDLNYRLSWQEVGSSVPYKLKRGPGGAGRAKQFAQLILFRSGFFTFNEVAKIIPFYG